MKEAFTPCTLTEGYDDSGSCVRGLPNLQPDDGVRQIRPAVQIVLSPRGENEVNGTPVGDLGCCCDPLGS